MTNRERAQNDFEGKHHACDRSVETRANAGTGSGRDEALHLVQAESGVSRERRADGATNEDDRALSTARAAGAEGGGGCDDLRRDEARGQIAALEI